MESQQKQSTRRSLISHLVHPSRKGIAILSIVMALGVILFGIVLLLNMNQHSSSPPYQTLLPDNKSIDQLGGWNRSQPPQGDAVYAYQDTVNGVPIRVTQQPLPESFKNDTAAHVAELAKGFNATDVVKDEDITLYIGTSAKGPQWVIFARNGLLVLIKSDKKIADVSWINYVGSLK